MNHNKSVERDDLLDNFIAFHLKSIGTDMSSSLFETIRGTLVVLEGSEGGCGDSTGEFSHFSLKEQIIFYPIWTSDPIKGTGNGLSMDRKWIGSE